MLTLIVKLAYLALFMFVLQGCAVNTFTQQGRVSSEETCYEDDCYITIYWQDGTFSQASKQSLPGTERVFRHCFIDQQKNTVCDEQIYEKPIRIFERRKDDLNTSQNQ